MSFRSLAIAAGLAAGLAIPTLAQAAYTTGAVNVRSGPGTNYQVILTARAGEPVVVRQCIPRWCKVNYAGVRGWMSSAYIAQGPRPYYGPKPYYPPKPYVYRQPPPPPPPPYYYPRNRWRGYPGAYQPNNSFGFYFGYSR